MKKKLLHLSQVLHSPHYHVIKAPHNSKAHFCPHFYSTERPLASFYRWCWLSVGETNGASTVWWWGDPARCRAEIPGGGSQVCAHVGLLTSLQPTRSQFWHLDTSSCDVAMEKQCCCLHPGELASIHRGKAGEGEGCTEVPPRIPIDTSASHCP